jgi:hypothetical protein
VGNLSPRGNVPIRLAPPRAHNEHDSGQLGNTVAKMIETIELDWKIYYVCWRDLYTLEYPLGLGGITEQSHRDPFPFGVIFSKQPNG